MNSKKRMQKLLDDIYNLNNIFENTDSKIISNAISTGGNVFAIKLEGFKGLIGKEIQPGRRFGTELAAYAKKMGVSGIFHTDELPAYGITDEEVETVSKHLELSKDDAFIIVADNKEKGNECYYRSSEKSKNSNY